LFNTIWECSFALLKIKKSRAGEHCSPLRKPKNPKPHIAVVVGGGGFVMNDIFATNRIVGEHSVLPKVGRAVYVNEWENMRANAVRPYIKRLEI
jgi:hypothetical protein